MYPQSDRRIFRRIEGEIPVRYMLPGNNRGYRTVTSDISGGGMRIPLIKKVAAGTVIDVEIFRNGSKRSAKCKGEIRWIGRLTLKGKKKKILQAGIRFLDLSFLFIGNLIGDLEARKITEQTAN